MSAPGSSPRPSAVPAVGLNELAALAGAASTPQATPGSEQIRVLGVSLDSRSVRPGDLYAALPGARAHGADFAAAALAAGAVAVLTDPVGAQRLRAQQRAGRIPATLAVLEVSDPRAVLAAVAARVYGEPSRRLRLVGITGTNGKTTTAYLLESALRALGQRTGLIGTVETRIGQDRIGSVRTTPESPDLQAIFALMLERGTQTAVMEVSSHALAQHRVDAVRYDVALFTNLSQDHLDFHADMDDYFAAKSALFTAARAERGVICVDDEWGRILHSRSEIDVISLSGTGVEADWTVSAGPQDSALLRGPGGTLRLTCHLPGTFNVTNTAMAALALLRLGYSPAEIEAAMAEPPQVPGRMERVPGGPADPRCLVDYAHTPEAVEAALAALRPSTPGRLVVVLGAGGDRDRGKRRPMGAAGRRWADDLIITDDNPRSEDPESIRAQVLEGTRDVLSADADLAPTGSDTTAHRRTVVTSSAGRAAHIARAVEIARDVPGSTVVVLGKGHETGQEIDGIVHPFDDRDALRAALEGRPYRPEDPE